MPFKSEKQRRFLWAKHPDIAKRWAHEYPKSNKGLPMYASDKRDENQPESKAAALSSLQQALVNDSGCKNKQSFAAVLGQIIKKANSKLEHIEMPASQRPTYAGEKQIESILKTETEDEGSIGKERAVNCENVGKNIENPLLHKLGVVLAPRIQQEIENRRAEEEARAANNVPQNVNLKQYPVVNNMVPPPMGMTAPPAQPQAPQQAQQPAQAQLAAVGGGNSPNANPINSFGGLSTNGDINGNAAFGTQNAMGGEKMAYGVWDEYGVAERTPYYDFKPADKLPAYLTRASELAAQKGYRLGFTNERYGESIPGKEYAEKLRKGKLPADYFDDDFPAFFDMHPMDTRSWWQKLIGKKYQDPKDTIDDLHGHNIDDDKEWQKHVDENWPVYRAYKEIYKTPEKPVTAKKANELNPWHTAVKASAQKCSCGCGDTTVTCKCSASCSCRQKGGSCYGLKVKQASSPAWQRAAGKNPEGGLNEKGRKSYERETGGNLKPPVTESNPSGERAKRQNSFCSRMCGMKRVNTGASTAKDPDSRINKSLRKWNCKCGSALEFGIKMGQLLHRA